MSIRSHLLAYSVGSTLGLAVGTIIGGAVVDAVQLRRDTKRRTK